MTRYFTLVLGTFAFMVALAVAQDKAPAPKKKAGADQDVQKNDAKDPDAKKADGNDAKDPDAKKADEKGEPAEDPQKIIERLKENFDKVGKDLEDKHPGDETRKIRLVL